MKYINRRVLFFLMIIGCIICITDYATTVSCPDNDHTYLEATCTEARKCSKCSWTDPDSKPLGHNNTQFGCGEIHCTSEVCIRCGEHECNGGHKPATCGMSHCSEVVCSVPGCTYHENECGGNCILVTCSHCKKEYCSRNDSYCEKGKYENHIAKETCLCDTKGVCTDEHCTAAGMAKGWCTLCYGDKHPHAPCNDDATCELGHCGKKMCSICKEHICGGDHDFSKWEITGSGEIQTHTKVCSVEGCNEIGGTHEANWGVADETHTSHCGGSCGITYTHTPQWKSTANDSSDISHQDKCTKVIGGIECKAIKTHEPNWGDYYKKGYETERNGGDGNNSENVHTRRCKYSYGDSVCGLEETVHEYTNDETWIASSSDEDEHIRECRVCKLTQVEEHSFNKKVPKSWNSEYEHLIKHYKICDKCSKADAEEIHSDENRNGECDECNQKLWAIECNGQDITNEIINGSFRNFTVEEAISIKEGSYDETEAKVRDVLNVIYENETPVVADDNKKIMIKQNGKYEFTLASGATVTFSINNICNDILIDTFKSIETATTEPVRITVRLNSYEQELVKAGYKKIYIREAEDEEDNISDSDFEKETNDIDKMLEPIIKDVSVNGIYYFSARDNIMGKTKTIAVVVNNIVNGHATVAVSEDVFVGGYVYTEILINSSEAWSLDDPLNPIHEAIDVRFTKVKVDGDETEDQITVEQERIKENGILKMKVMDLRRNNAVLNENKKYVPGIYYIQIGIGGSDVFSEKGTYIIDLKSVTLDGEEKALEGKNRLLVEVQELNDLT